MLTTSIQYKGPYIYSSFLLLLTLIFVFFLRSSALTHLFWSAAVIAWCWGFLAGSLFSLSGNITDDSQTNLVKWFFFKFCFFYTPSNPRSSSNLIGKKNLHECYSNIHPLSSHQLPYLSHSYNPIPAPTPDVLCWGPTQHGHFSIKSATWFGQLPLIDP